MQVPVPPDQRLEGAVKNLDNTQPGQQQKAKPRQDPLRQIRAEAAAHKQREPQASAANSADAGHRTKWHPNMIGAIGKAGHKGVHRQGNDQQPRLKKGAQQRLHSHPHPVSFFSMVCVPLRFCPSPVSLSAGIPVLSTGTKIPRGKASACHGGLCLFSSENPSASLSGWDGAVFAGPWLQSAESVPG